MVQPLMNAIMNRMRAVVFDFDGTLAQTRIDFKRMRLAIIQHLEQWGLDKEILDRDAYVLELVARGRTVLGDTSGRGEAFAQGAM
jgi:phosphoglycolate phosphatase-like HAD superfamily hydrolase